MEKLVNIGGKDVTLKASVFTQILYKNTFGKNLNADLVRTYELAEKAAQNAELAPSERTEISGDVDRIYLQILWAFAKEGDDSVPTFEKWLKGFESINLKDIMPSVMEVYTASMAVDRKNG